jgi:hypothetical protein
VFTLANNALNTTTSQNLIAYCFAPVAGYSAFGSYTGNGSTDGTFVFTGFRPRFLMIKRTDFGTQWWMWDSSRNTFNVTNSGLTANGSGAENANNADLAIDFLSNGFKLRNTLSTLNASGGTYIYAAFCESPFKNSLAR